jgi:hypothetical protein
MNNNLDNKLVFLLTLVPSSATFSLLQNYSDFSNNMMKLAVANVLSPISNGFPPMKYSSYCLTKIVPSK